jgi:nitrogen regulatory protein P-II 2
MKLVTALIRPFKLEEVRVQLLRFGHVAAIAEVKVFTPRRDAQPGTPHAIEANKFHAKVKIEVLVPTEEADKAIAILRHAAQTGRLGEGDGVIFVSPVEQAIRIRTGATGDEAV